MSVESDRPRGGVVSGIRVDVRQLHDAWMELLFPRQRDAAHSVLGRWRPETTRDKVTYWLWAAVGILPILVLYPLALAGFATRFYSRRFDSAATRLGVLGVVLLAVVVWGALTALAYVSFDTLRPVYAIGGASIVAVVSAGFAAVFSQKGGRVSTVVLAYPFGVTAILLPPVVAALYSDALAAVVLNPSYDLAAVVLNDYLPRVPVYGERASAYLQDNFELVGAAYAVMWFGIAVPLGWLLGLLVTLADAVRPTAEADDTAEASGD